MKLPSSEQIMAATDAISEGSAMADFGRYSFIPNLTMSSTILVTVKPGAIAFTLIESSISS